MKYKIVIFLLFGVFMVETKVVRDQNKFTKAKLENGYDPGKCNQSNHATFVVVKDRENNDRLLICAEENDVYNWKTTDGSDPTGEFFNPAYDCLKILDKNPEAKDGFYWIKLSGIVPKKIWCDMKTDGGGWILIGRKNSSVTWTVPSNSNPVEPFGEPHWSSSLGDVPILDFRVQMATQADFGATRAHWFFRLQNKRPLKNLLVVNEGGCGRLSPGIGDISYVKDLQTGKIVTTKFRCSHFGTYHPKSSKYGWDMMNFCLEKPCPLGFAFHHKYSDQIDYSGAFSYSTSSSTSGFTHDSTSFVGCDNRKCCGCFGPIGGTKDYCGVECRTRQGGTIAKSIYTWFWVRSSLSKRLWNKCMEYKVTLVNGKVVWYKLYKGKAVPILGRCTQKEALLNDGIIVVPDAAAARKVPPVPGLLEYRKDNQKLYIRLNETWSMIGGDEEVMKGAVEQVKQKLDQIEKMTRLLNTSLADLKSQLQNVTDTVRDRIKHEKVIAFHAKFTNLGATGRLGPTTLGSHYMGKDHEKIVSLHAGIQHWSVPYAGAYEITAVGAAGGLGVGGSSPGRGAYMRGVFEFRKGHVLKILVGQEGVKNTKSRSSGGGGGTFVATSSNTPLIVAGGGGGMETLNQRFANCDASTGTSGRKNKCLRSCAIWSGGANGKGASEADTSNSGGGGGGFYSNGRSSKQFGGAYGVGGEGGRGFVQGGSGGRAKHNNAVGGFGGGGGAYGTGGGAGGGGGYSGGASGNNNYDSCAGGGGSFNSGKNQVTKEGYLARGHGYVEIRRLA